MAEVKHVVARGALALVAGQGYRHLRELSEDYFSNRGR